MFICFTVGTTEPNRVEFSFDQWASGRYFVKVNDVIVLRGFRFVSLSNVGNFEIKLGKTEKHSVRIQKRKFRFFGGVLPQTYSVFVNDSLLFTVRGY